MTTSYQIKLTLHTTKGDYAYGTFELGGRKAFAQEVFDKLQGEHADQQSCHIRTELHESIADLTVPIAIKYCKLAELRNNVAMISREIFKLAHFEEGFLQ